jgi:hypothetical protein
VPGPSFICRPLSEEHELGHFACGDDEYDEFLIDEAREAQANHYSNVFVLTPVERPNYVVAYFTLSNSSVNRATMTSRFAKRARHASIPATLIGMLARDQSQRAMMPIILRAAFERLVQAAQISASRLVVIDAASEELASLYETYGFSRAKQVDSASPIRLVYLTHDLIKALGESDEAQLESPADPSI